MSWVTTVSIVLITLLVLNSLYVVFWLRPKLSNEAKAKSEKTWKRKAGPTELLASILVVICGIALVFIPVMAPTSQLAKWIAEHGVINYAIWCIFGVVVLIVIFGLIGLILKKNDAA